MMGRLRDLSRSFAHAFRGIQYAIREERNFRIHICAAVTVFGLGALYRCQSQEWAVLILTVASVMALELMNTSVEKTVDLITKERREEARVAKDCGAAMVLVEALGSVAIAVCVFGDPCRWREVGERIAPHMGLWAAGVFLWIVVMIVYIFYFPKRGKEK